MKHLLLDHGLFLAWTLLCIGAGVLLSRRLISTTTELYATLYHEAQSAKQDAYQALQELRSLKDKITAKAQDAEAAAKKIISH